MKLGVALFGLAIVAIGALGLVSPARLMAVVRRWPSRFGLLLAAALRIVAGGMMILAAPVSRAPLYLQVLGWVALVAGLLTPLFGVRRFAALAAWWSAQPPALVRALCVLVVALGGSLVWAVAP